MMVKFAAIRTRRLRPSAVAGRLQLCSTSLLFPPTLIAAAVFLVFWPAVDADFVNWDDNFLLVENERYRGFGPEQLRWMFTTFHMGHYQPLTWVSYALDHLVWGMEPRGYHLTNVILHAANAVLIYVLARRLFDLALGASRTRTVPPLLAALLFAVHPLRTESVAWVTARRDLLSTFFFLLAVISWLRFREREGRDARWYAASVVCFLLSLLSKAWTMTLPAVLLVLDVWPLRRLERSGIAALVREKAAFLLLAAAAAATAFLAAWQKGAVVDIAQFTLVQRISQVFYGLAFYLRKSIAPTALSPVYLLDKQLDPTAPPYVLSALVVAGLAALLILCRRRWPAALAAFAGYAVLVSPVLGLAQSGVQLVADRYSYISCIPLALLAGAVLGSRPARAVAAGVLLLVLGLLTRHQASVWHDPLSLWNHTLAVDRENWVAHNGRGSAHQSAGDLEQAEADYDAAIRLNPRFAVAYLNRGHLRMRRGDADGALADWDRAVEIRPTFADALMNRGAARLTRGDAEGAVRDLEATTRLKPESFTAWYNLATAHVVVGRLDLALVDIERAIAVSPPEGELREKAERKLEALREEIQRAR
jgi:tetratricopeptide (TPR) repeat protein